MQYDNWKLQSPYEKEDEGELQECKICGHEFEHLEKGICEECQLKKNMFEVLCTFNSNEFLILQVNDMFYVYLYPIQINKFKPVHKSAHIWDYFQEYFDEVPLKFIEVVNQVACRGWIFDLDSIQNDYLYLD